MKKVLIINLGWEQEPLIDAVASTGSDLYGIHYSDNIYKKELFKDILIADLRNLSEIINFADQVKPDAVISDQCDYSFFAQAILYQKYQLPGPNIQEAQISSNKFIQREIALEKKLPIPKFKIIYHPDDLSLFIEEVGYPIIVKPIDNRGSIGVIKITTEKELLPAYLNSLTNSHSRWVIAEKFIDGFEITIDGYCFQNKPYSLALAKKGHIDDVKQVSIDIKYPGELSDELYNKALRLNEEVIGKLGYKFGMTHAEYIVSASEDIYLIEAANRGGGVYTSEIIVPNVSMINILNAYINDCLQSTLTCPPERIERNEVILKFFSFEPGTIKSIEGIESIIQDPCLLKFRLAVKPGDIIHSISNDSNRHGFVIVKSVTNVRAKAQEIMEKLKVIYTKV